VTWEKSRLKYFSNRKHKIEPVQSQKRRTMPLPLPLAGHSPGFQVVQGCEIVVQGFGVKKLPPAVTFFTWRRNNTESWPFLVTLSVTSCFSVTVVLVDIS
jgi:hypothetical protein